MTVFDILQMMPADQRESMMDAMEEQMGDMPDTILDQAAVSYVGTVYEISEWIWMTYRSTIF